MLEYQFIYDCSFPVKIVYYHTGKLSIRCYCLWNIFFMCCEHMFKKKKKKEAYCCIEFWLIFLSIGMAWHGNPTVTDYGLVIPATLSNPPLVLKWIHLDCISHLVHIIPHLQFEHSLCISLFQLNLIVVNIIGRCIWEWGIIFWCYIIQLYCLRYKTTLCITSFILLW